MDRVVGQEVLGDERAAYGAQIVASLGRRLAVGYGRSYDAKNLRRMIQPDEVIVVTLSRQSNWSHFRASDAVCRKRSAA